MDDSREHRAAPKPPEVRRLEGHIEDLGARQRVERMRVIATALIEIVRQNEGEMEAQAARRKTADALSISDDEVRYGELYAERTGTLIPTKYRSSVRLPSDNDTE